MPSFDIMCEANAVELKNAVDTANKEIANRFDFKGSDARIELKDKEHEITVFADDDFKLGQVRDVLLSKMAKRGVDARFLDAKDPEKIGGDKVKQKMVVRNGVESELAKRIVKLIKDNKVKVTASIQGDVVRVTGTPCRRWPRRRRSMPRSVSATCRRTTTTRSRGRASSASRSRT